ncbi:contact-dependent growth inhibition system immunity protein [Aliiroseovarius marinus]|uniref:contact-dependent growth inhibition system immunity protein n=1 Tax=Aliiroseovarius marinus TaxID=2500159 RepID=UPI003D7C935F
MPEEAEGRGPASLADKTLEEIDGQRWPTPCCASYLVATTTALRQKPLGQFTTEDLRIMIAQDIGAGVLKPFALAVLRDDPMAEGDYYPGDLLEAARRRWPDDPELDALT